MIFNNDRAKLGSYVRDLADLMGLRDWVITVKDEPPEHTEYLGSMNVAYGSKRASIWFADNWASETPERFRQTCVHELLHCHFYPLEWQMNNLSPYLGSHVFEMYRESFRDVFEVGVDGIAISWAETMPLPGTTRKRRTKG